VTTVRLLRQFTPTELRIGTGIVAGLSYREMATEMRRKPRTVRFCVMTMARKIVGLEDMPPRWAVFAYFKFAEWNR